jgi:hypothetical protein
MSIVQMRGRAGSTARVISSRRSDMEPGDGIAEFFSELGRWEYEPPDLTAVSHGAVPRIRIGLMRGRRITTFFQASLT